MVLITACGIFMFPYFMVRNACSAAIRNKISLKFVGEVTDSEDGIVG